MSEQETESPDALTADEQAFFDSGGEKELAQESEQETETDGVQQAEAEQAETKAAEEVGDATDEQTGEDKGQKSTTVPHQALHAEREEHKKTRAGFEEYRNTVEPQLREIQELREFKGRMEERWRQFDAAQQKQEPPVEDDPEPDPNVDVFAHNQWLARRTARLEERIAAEANERAKTSEAAAQAAQATEYDKKVWDYWHQDSSAYIAKTPEFKDAAEWLAKERDKQLTALARVNPAMANPQARGAQIDAELKEIIVAAAQQRMSPAQYVHQMAIDWGWTPQQAEQAVAAVEDAQPAAKATEAADGIAERLQKLEQAQNGSRTVGQASGQGGDDEMTPEALANLPAHEFDAWMSKPTNARKFKEMMGG